MIALFAGTVLFGCASSKTEEPAAAETPGAAVTSAPEETAAPAETPEPAPVKNIVTFEESSDPVNDEILIRNTMRKMAFFTEYIHMEVDASFNRYLGTVSTSNMTVFGYSGNLEFLYEDDNPDIDALLWTSYSQLSEEEYEAFLIRCDTFMKSKECVKEETEYSAETYIWNRDTAERAELILYVWHESDGTVKVRWDKNGI